MAKREQPFNNPFGALKVQRPPEKSKAPARAATRPAPEPELDEGALFRQAIGGVERVKKGPLLAHVPRPKPDPRIVDPELEALAELAELVAGERELNLADSDEFIEGAVPGLDPSLVTRLRKGEFALQAHLDLHGLIVAEAKEALIRFMEESRRRHHRCVLVVHGRGLHSKDQIPVLKENVRGWLSRGRIGRQVLAFTTALPNDGGAGAVYVLLRK